MHLIEEVFELLPSHGCSRQMVKRSVLWTFFQLQPCKDCKWEGVPKCSQNKEMLSSLHLVIGASMDKDY